MPMISHVRVSTEDQLSLPQSVALQSAGCAEIFEEHTSDGNRAAFVGTRRPSTWLGENQSLKYAFTARSNRLCVQRHSWGRSH